MIDWNKPIETVDGRKVAVLMVNAVHIGMTGAKPVAIVKIEGGREDGSEWFSTYPMCGIVPPNLDIPQLLNVRVKREGWVLRRPLGELEGGVVAALAVRYVFPTENEAKEAMKYYTLPDGVVPVRMQWEE